MEVCKARLRAAAAEMEESKKASFGNTCLGQEKRNCVYQLVFGMFADLTIDFADNPGVNPENLQEDEQRAQQQLEAGEHVLTWVRREKNDRLDANTRLGMELKDVRAQLADSVKENRRLQRGIFSMCSNEPLYSSG